MEATEAMRTVRDFRAKEKSQLKLSELEQEAAKMNVPMSEIIASRSDTNPALYLSRLIGQATAATKTTGTRGSAAKNVALDELERYETLYSKAIESDSPMTDFYARKIKQLADQLDEKPATTAGNFAGSLTYNDGAAKPAAAETKQPAVPTLPPALPATPEEERQLAAQQQRAVAETQKQQLADASWTGLKGTAAARGAEAGTPPDVISEARKAIVGGATTSKRAQRIAALARAYADGRAVQTTRQVREDFSPTGRIIDMPVRLSPEEVLVQELGYEPDAIVGQAPSRPGERPRNVTALEAARAILADAADPFIKLKQGIKQTEKAVEADVEGEEVFGAAKWIHAPVHTVGIVGVSSVLVPATHELLGVVVNLSSC